MKLYESAFLVTLFGISSLFGMIIAEECMPAGVPPPLEQPSSPQEPPPLEQPSSPHEPLPLEQPSSTPEPLQPDSPPDANVDNSDDERAKESWHVQFKTAIGIILSICLIILPRSLKTAKRKYTFYKTRLVLKLRARRLWARLPPQQWVDRLLEVIKCPICLKTLRPLTVLCVNGHGICLICKVEELRKCPVCLEDFAQMNSNHLLRQMLEVIGILFCKFCRRPVEDGSSHEAVCGERPTACKLCEWSGDGRELLGHVTREHPGSSVLGEATRPVEWPGFDPAEFFKALAPVSVAGAFIWHELVFQPSTEILTITFHPVATGKSCDQLCATVALHFKHKGYETQLILTMDPDADPYRFNSILVPISAVKSFITEDRILQYDLLFKQVDVQTYTVKTRRR